MVDMRTPLATITNSDHIPGWVDGRIMVDLRALAVGLQTIVNIGVWKGKSVGALAETGAGLVYAVDHFHGSVDEVDTTHKQAADDPLSVYLEFHAYMNQLGLWHKIIPLSCDSADASVYFKDGMVDLIFIDGDHRAHAVFGDISHWWPKLKPGGVMCGDDYTWPSVALAVRDWLIVLKDVDHQILRVEKRHEDKFWLLRRPKE
jgi:hypothetical protein